MKIIFGTEKQRDWATAIRLHLIDNVNKSLCTEDAAKTHVIDYLINIQSAVHIIAMKDCTVASLLHETGYVTNTEDPPKEKKKLTCSDYVTHIKDPSKEKKKLTCSYETVEQKQDRARSAKVTRRSWQRSWERSWERSWQRSWQIKVNKPYTILGECKWNMHQ